MTKQFVRGPLEALETRHGVFDAKSAQGVDSCPELLVVNANVMVVLRFSAFALSFCSLFLP